MIQVHKEGVEEAGEPRQMILDDKEKKQIPGVEKARREGKESHKKEFK